MTIGLTRPQGTMASVLRTGAVVGQVKGRGDARLLHLEQRPDLERVALEGVPCAGALDLCMCVYVCVYVCMCMMVLNG